MSEGTAFSVASLTTLLLEGLALSVVAVRVHRIILFNDRRPGEYFAFPFGKTEILYVLMGAPAFAFFIALFAVLVFGTATLLAAAGSNEANGRAVTKR